MSQGRERINPEDLGRALDDDNSVVEVSLDFGALGGGTGNQSGVVFERRPKTPQDDRDLGLIPQLLSQPKLFEELMGQMDRGEIRDVTESRNPRVQKMVADFLQQNPDLRPQQPIRTTPTFGNPIMRALNSFGNRVRRILHH